jgi:hypothetical protein
MRARKALSVALMLIAASVVGQSAAAKDKSAQDMIRTFPAPVDKVYAGIVQVVSADYNLKAAVAAAYTVNFFTGGKFSMVVSAVCHDSGDGQTTVTLSIAPAEGNPQIFGLGGEKSKLAQRFWAQLYSTLANNGKLETKSNPQEMSTKPVVAQRPSEIAIKSTPDGADITIDGKFSGNTPSTLQLSAGDHTVSVAAKGFQKWERTITLSPGGTITLNATLDPQTPSPH